MGALERTTGMPSPTIAAVLAEFLDEQQQRLSPKTFAQYQDVVELLQHSLNGYAYLTLSGLDAKRFDQRFNAPGDAHREFCELFGPEHILPNVGEFLGYFMVRKVIAGPALLRAAGTVTKKLAAWLAEKGYADPATVRSPRSMGPRPPGISRRPRRSPPAWRSLRRRKLWTTRASRSRTTSKSRGSSRAGSGWKASMATSMARSRYPSAQPPVSGGMDHLWGRGAGGPALAAARSLERLP